MTKLNAWRLTAVVLAVLFVAMVMRDLTGPAPETPPAVTVPAGETSAGDPEAPAGSGDQDTPTREGDEGAAGRDTVSSTDPALDLAMRTLILGRGKGANWFKVLPKLRPRGDELIPILEDWLRRREELKRQGIDLRNVPRAYAELAGVRSLPLLGEVLSDPDRRWSRAANEALPYIDDPRATDLIRRHQASLQQGHSDVRYGLLWKASPASRELLKAWARKPPENSPVRGVTCRSEWFRRGTSEDREEVWKLMDDLERLTVLGGGHARHWGGPWPERYRTLVSEGLNSGDPRIRCRAIHNVIADADAASPALLAEAERALDHEIPAAEGRRMTDGPTQRSLLSLKKSLQTWRERQASEMKSRELLTPR